MKFIDRYKLSLHNIKNNKSRSILTTIIVYIISLLIMTILSLAISVSNNANKVVKDYYQSINEPITTEYYLYSYYEEEKIDDVFDKSVYEDLKPIIEKHTPIISYATYGDNFSDILLTNHNFPLSAYYEIIEGNNVDENDVDTNKVLVSVDFANSYYQEHQTKLNPGDKFTYSITDYSDHENHQTLELTFEVKGIYIHKSIDVEEYSIPLRKNNDIIVDVDYVLRKFKTMNFETVKFYHVTTKTNFNSHELQDNLQSFVNDFKDIAPQYPDSDRGDTVHCYALSDIKSSHLMGTIIIGFASFLCLILILLSIGSLANTIMISVDKNKKFIGLLKALGLNEKDLKGTIKLESITTIILGILLSFITIYLASELLKELNEIIIGFMFSHYIKAIDYQIIFSIPIYIPVIVTIFFVLFTFLFSRSSMAKIAKTDPMQVISEVA